MKRYTTPERMDEACLGDYPRLDADFYDGFEQFLRGRGFRLLGDVCITTPGLAKALGRNTVYRCMCDATGTVMAAAYQIGFTRTRRIMLRLLGIRGDRVIEMRAATADGDIVLAGNIHAPAFQRKWLSASGVRYQPSPPGTPVAAMYANWLNLMAQTAEDASVGGRTLLKLNTIGLQKSVMEYEEEKTIHLMRAGTKITPEEFARCVNIYFEPSNLTVAGWAELQKQKVQQ